MRKKVFLVFLLILIAQLGLYWYLHVRADRITPPGHVHLFADEHASYVPVIRQSKNGEWAYTFPYTTLPMSKIYNYLFFIGAGKIAAIFNIDPVVMYEITRVTGGIAVLVTTYWLITLLFPTSLHIPAIIFTMLFETGPMWSTMLHISVWQWKTSYNIPALLDRNFYLAHHLWAEALGLALLVVIFRAIQKPSRRMLLFTLILSVAAPIVNPTFSIILVPCLFIPWLFWAAATKSLKRTFLPITIAIAGIGGVSLWTLQQYSSAGQPWSTAAVIQKSWWTTSDILTPFFQSQVLFYPFVVILLILVPLTWNKWSSEMRRTFVLALCWSVLPIGLIYLSAIPWFPLVNGRIATDLSMVPIGILSTFVFYAVGLTKWFRRYLKLLIVFIFLLITGASLFLSEVYVTQMLQNQDQTAIPGNSWVKYPTTDFWNGMMALKNIPLWSHIMVYPNTANVLPIYLPVRVFLPSTYEGYGWKERNDQSYFFYTGELSNDDLHKLLIENAISYVFVGPEELNSLKTPTFYPDTLDVMYKNPEVTIYKVRPWQ
jgi:hypothetical protein